MNGKRSLFYLALSAVIALAALGIGAWAGSNAPAQAAPATVQFPQPVGQASTITRITGDALTIKSATGTLMQVRVDASTVVLKGGFSSLGALRVGDALFVDPAFTPPPPANGSSAGAPGQGTGGVPPVGDPNAGRRPGAAPPPPQNAAPPMGPNQPGQPGQPGQSPPQGGAAGSRPGTPGGTNNSAPSSGSQPGDPAGRNSAPAARLLWVPQAGDTLTSAPVRSVSGGKITLQWGNLLLNVQPDKNVVVRRVPSAGAPSVAASLADVAPGSMLVAVGARGSSKDGASTFYARAILVLPTQPGARTPR